MRFDHGFDRTQGLRRTLWSDRCVGDGVRVADTSLIAVVEKDHAVYGDECLHGGGKTLRDGIGLAAGVTSAQGALDLLLCNVLVIDPVIGIVKGDLGI